MFRFRRLLNNVYIDTLCKTTLGSNLIFFFSFVFELKTGSCLLLV